jgi:hypothetical protein
MVIYTYCITLSRSLLAIFLEYELLVPNVETQQSVVSSFLSLKFLNESKLRIRRV